MNGFAKYRFLMIINIIGQMMGLGVTLLLIWQNYIEGALLAVVIAPSLMFLITLVGILNRRNLSGLVNIKNIDLSWLKRFQPFIIMAIVSGIALPLVLIMIRNYIIDSEGLKEAGYWEAMNRISSYYLMFINSIMTLYFLPRFAEINSKTEFKKEIYSFYRSIIPILLIGLVALYLLRPIIVSLLLSEEFKPVEGLFSWQLMGDFVKVLSVVIAYHFIAKKMFWHFIITESFLIIITYFTSVYFIDIYGVVGANIGHFASYVMYFLVILLVIGTSMFGIIQDPENTVE